MLRIYTVVIITQQCMVLEGAWWVSGKTTITVLHQTKFILEESLSPPNSPG